MKQAQEGICNPGMVEEFGGQGSTLNNTVVLTNKEATSIATIH
jgi:hypothetical protein